MQITDEQLSRWTSPASEHEEAKAERTERMIREAVNAHPVLKDLPIRVHAKGSVKNNTNVRLNSDVDVAVEYEGMIQLEYANGGHFGMTGLTPYSGPYQNGQLYLYKAAVGAAMQEAFGPASVDSSGNRVFRVRASDKSLAADVAPCTTYWFYWPNSFHKGIELILDRSDGLRHFNYPDQHLTGGRDKNTRTGRRYKSVVRIIKNIEDQLVKAGKMQEVPSFLIECLVYNVPDSVFTAATPWRQMVVNTCSAIWAYTQSPEPTTGRWTEVNGIKWLFSPSQRWTPAHAANLAAHVYGAVTT